jgi:hypothetical protein
MPVRKNDCGPVETGTPRKKRATANFCDLQLILGRRATTMFFKRDSLGVGQTSRQRCSPPMTGFGTGAAAVEWDRGFFEDKAGKPLKSVSLYQSRPNDFSGALVSN